MKTEKFIQLLSNNRKLIAGPCKKQFFLSFYLFYYIHTPVPPLSQANQSDGNSVAREVEFDHHLTTSSSQPVPCIVFYVPTFFYNHHKQRRKLCILHNFRRFIMLFACASQFSDPKGRRFESCQPHQKMHVLTFCGNVRFYLYIEFLWAVRSLQPHHLPQFLLGFPLFLVKGMGINDQRRTRLGMTQQAGHGADDAAAGYPGAPLPAPCRCPAGGNRCVPETPCRRAPTGRRSPACLCRFPANRWRKSAASCASGNLSGIRCGHTSCVGDG